MDKFLRSVKVVSLLEHNCGCYLTASQDKKSITLVRKQEWSENDDVLPEGSEWRLKWVEGPDRVLTGKCRLYSIYKKALMVRREGKGQNGYLRVFQDSLPALDQDVTAAEWSLSLKQLSFEGGIGIEAQLSIDYERQSYFLAGPKSMMCTYDRFAYPILEPRTSVCRLRLHDWIIVQLVNAEKLLKRKDDCKKPKPASNSNALPPPRTTSTCITTTREQVAVASAPVTYSGQVSQFTGWQVGQVVLNYFTTGVGGSYSHYNSGHNVNFSGTQSNGDVNVHTEIGKTRDVIDYLNRNKS